LTGKKNSICIKHMLLLICACFVAITLMVGLWPFKFHMSNKVQWLEDRNGIGFQNLGVTYSREMIDFDSNGFSIGILVKPLHGRTKTIDYILEMNDGGKNGILAIGQWNSYLILMGRKNGSGSKEGHFEIGIKDVLEKGILNYLVINSEEKGVSVYSNGKLVGFFPEHSFNGTDDRRKARLILGNSATGNHGWSGKIFHLSISDWTLSEEEMQSCYMNWIRENAPASPSGQGVSYEYLFREGKGNSVNNEKGEVGELVIPDRFRVLRKRILIPPWAEFHLDRNYFFDVAINTIGFIPLGFFLALYLTRVLELKGRSAYIAAIAAGVVLSLAIELTQVFIPVRESSCGDLILNSLGTVMGVMFLSLVTLVRRNS